MNPLPDQVNEEGSDPEETDSDLEDENEDQTEVIMDVDDQDIVDNGSDSVSEEGEKETEPRTRNAKAAAPKSRAKGTKLPPKNEALTDAITIKARLPPCQIGAVEFLTFFPHHTQWPEAGLRLYRNGWNHSDVARIQLNARATLDEESYTRRYNALKYQILSNGRIFFNVSDFKPSSATHNQLLTAVKSYDASNYAPRDTHVNVLEDATLVDIAKGVVNWPTGQDRGIVTQAIEYAFNNDLHQYTSANIPGLAQQMGFTAPAEASTDQWDQNACQRVEQIAGPAPKKSNSKS